MRDTIFDCIETHRNAVTEFAIAHDALNELESTLDADMIREPRVQYGWLNSWTDAPKVPLYINSHDEIKAWVDDQIETHRSRFYGIPSMVDTSVADMEKRRTDLHDALAADELEQQRRRDGCGWTAAKEFNDNAYDRKRAAAIAFLTTVPTSLEGIAAALAYAEETALDGVMWPATIDHGGTPFDGLPWHVAFHRNIAGAMATIVPPPAMNAA